MPNPSFPVVTLAVWNDVLPTAISDELSNKSAEMAAEGKTDDVPEFVDMSPKSGTNRNWLDSSAATEWINFVSACGGPLDSISIVS